MTPTNPQDGVERLPDPNEPAYEAARQRMAAILHAIGAEDDRNGYTEMADDLLNGDLMQVPTWIALGMIAQPIADAGSTIKEALAELVEAVRNSFPREEINRGPLVRALAGADAILDVVSANPSEIPTGCTPLESTSDAVSKREEIAQIIARAYGGSLYPGLGVLGDYPTDEPDYLAADAILATLRTAPSERAGED